MRKTLFLTGAGMAMYWDGISTDCITEELVRKSEVFVIIHEKLKEEGHDSNFEDIVNAIEMLFQYYYCLDFGVSNRKSFVLSKLFDVNKTLLKDLDPIIKKYDRPHRVFYSDLFWETLGFITNLIHKYSDNVSLNKEKNENFSAFLNCFSNTIRGYTTNYDRLFIDACESIKFFDGFNDKPFFNNYRRFNYPRVIDDRNCNSYYNLHGSIYWDVPEGENQLAFDDSGFFAKQPNYRNQSPQTLLSNPNEFILVSPIITGYNKTQRTNLEPFNVLFNSFLQDCFTTDEWYIIGYSFSDPHINNALSTAYNNRAGNSPRIIWVSMEKECKTNIDLPFKFAEFRELFRLPPYSEACYKNPVDYFFHYSDSSVYLYFGGFEKFLTDKIWQQII
ncbi:MAG: SIR2 family protein [Bacteroidales bacterium]|nr:SIR2 family protein [Bacteroidales bacterium]